MDRVTDMTSGPPAKLILRLSVPLILTSLGQQMYGIVDAVIVGRGVGVGAFAALGACDWLNWMVLWSLQGLAQGFSSLVAQSFGAGDEDGLKRVTAMCARLGLLLGGAVTLIGVATAGPLLRLLGTPREILADASVYLRMIWGGSLIVLGYNLAAAVLRAAGDGRTPLTAMLTAGTANVLLDLLFVMVFRRGIAGAAAATLLSQLLALLYCLNVLRRTGRFRLSPGSRRWDGRIAGRLCRLGLPMAASSLTVVAGGILAQTAINRCGTVFVAGCTAANKLHGLLDCSAVAIGFAAAAYIGQNLGAGRLDRIRAGAYRAALIALALGSAVMLGMFLFGRQIVGLFLAGDVPDAAEALGIAARYVFVMSAMLDAAYIMNLYRYSLQGLGNTAVPLISGLFEFGARVFVAFVFPRLMGPEGLFFMDGSAWIAAGIYQCACFYRTLRRLERSARPPAA